MNDEIVASSIKSMVRNLNELKKELEAHGVNVEYRVTMYHSEGEIGQLKVTITKTL